MSSETLPLYAHLSRIEAKQLADLLLADDTARKPLVIDVRDPGTEGGFIRGAVNIPKVKFDDETFLTSIVKKYKDETAIVFHCLNCNGRGPTAALLFYNKLNEVVAEDEHKPVVQVLHRGFKLFSEVRSTVLI